MDPNSMTKSQLRSALTGHDVSVPASARKSVFVGLYADHVLFRNCNCRSATIRVRDTTNSNMTTSGFSSDDDFDDYIQPVAEQQKGKPGIIGWLSNVFSGSGDTGAYPKGIQSVPPANPNYGNVLSQNNNKPGQQPLYRPNNNKRGQKQQLGPGSPKRGQQKQQLDGSSSTKLGQQQQQRISSPNSTKLGQQQQQRFNGPNTKPGPPRLTGPKNTKRGQQRPGTPNNKTVYGQQQQPYMPNRGLLSGPHRMLQQQQARITARAKQKLFATKKVMPVIRPIPPEHKWPGPPRSPPRTNVLNVFRKLSSFFPNASLDNCECLGARGDSSRGRGRGRGVSVGVGSDDIRSGGLFSAFSSPLPYPRRGLKPGKGNYACVKRGKQPKQTGPPAWSPCMLPTSDELNQRIKDQQEHILELNSQGGKKKDGRLMAALPFTQEQIEVMSNSELLETLRQHGINCGPIVPSTRLVYQKKLLNILSGGLVPWKHSHSAGAVEAQNSRTESYSDKDDDDDNADIFDSSDEEEEMTPAKLNIIQTKRGKVVAPERVIASGGVPKSPRRRIVPESRFSQSDAGSERSQQGSDETLLAESERLLHPAKKERRVPGYLQVLIFIFVSIIIYLIIYNIEPVFKHPISRLH